MQSETSGRGKATGGRIAVEADAYTKEDDDSTPRSFLQHGNGLRAEAAAFLTANGAAIYRQNAIFGTFPSGVHQLRRCLRLRPPRIDLRY